ncbi:MAG: LCP family protein, partial [Acutalibacteraceae bacterium]
MKLSTDKIDKLLGTGNKKADPKAERKKQMRERKIDMRFIIIAFAAVVVVLAVISAVTVISEKGGKTSETTTSDTLLAAAMSDTSSEGKLSEEQLPLNANILLAFTEDGNSGLELLSVINIDSEAGKIRVSYIPTTTSQPVNNLSGTMAEHIENGGIKELLWAVGEYADISIERYVCIDEADFVDIMKKIGDFEVKIDEDISHDYNGISFIIDEGTHQFAPDSMLKYIVYLCNTLSSDPKTLTDIMAGIAGKLISDEKGNKITSESYDKVINFVETDISAIDIVNYSQAISKLFDSGLLWDIEIEQEVSRLKSEISTPFS